MKKLPLKGIAFGCLIMALLVVARSAVSVGKAFYYHMDWIPELVEDPWFIVGIVAAIAGIAALILMGVYRKKADPILPEETAFSEEADLQPESLKETTEEIE